MKLGLENQYEQSEFIYNFFDRLLKGCYHIKLYDLSSLLTNQLIGCHNGSFGFKFLRHNYIIVVKLQ